MSHHDDHHHHDCRHHHHDCRHHHHDDHRQRGERRRQGGERGPEDTEFLDLEPTRLLLGAASGVAKEVLVDLLRAAVRQRLEERLGEEIQRIGFAAADVLADDFEANRRIEAVLEDRRSSRKDLEERLAATLRAPADAPPAQAPGGSSASKSSASRRTRAPGSKRGRG
ncbi:MAG: hypothetical protein KC766_37230 [Myxococcales bacterium]|nr:hypothetical protein [Myxococcales bacterium]